MQLKNNATLISIKCNGQNMTLVSDSQNQYTITLNKQNTGSFVIEAIDSRTNKTTHTITKTLINYVQLTQNGTFKRTSNTSGKVLLDYSGNYWSGNFGVLSNSLSVCWDYREKGSSTWIEGTCIANPTIDTTNFKYSGSSISLNNLLGVTDNFFDYTKDYEFLLTVEDEIQQISIQYSLSKGIPHTAWYEDGLMAHNGDIDITGDYKKDGQSIITTVVDSLNSSSSTSALSAKQGKNLDTRLKKIETYSSTEQVIGTWFGKPLYRKCYTGTIGNISNNTIDSSIKRNTHTPINIYGTAYAMYDQWWPILQKFDDNGYSLFAYVDDGGIKFNWGNYFNSSSIFNFVIEYTKNSD